MPEVIEKAPEKQRSEPAPTSADKVGRMLRRREVLGLVGVGQSTIYAWMAAGEFPRPVALGQKLVGWREGDVAAWLAARPTKGG